MYLNLSILVLLGSLYSQAVEPKTRLVFSIDQGFGNGIVANGDVAVLNRMVTALEPLRAKYEVSVLLNPMIKDKQRLKLMLNALAAQKMPFVFDVIPQTASSSARMVRRMHRLIRVMGNPFPGSNLRPSKSRMERGSSVCASWKSLVRTTASGR